MAPQSWAIKRPGRFMEILNFGPPWAHGVRPGTPKIHPWAPGVRPGTPKIHPGAPGVRPELPLGPRGPRGETTIRSI